MRQSKYIYNTIKLTRQLKKQAVIIESVSERRWRAHENTLSVGVFIVTLFLVAFETRAILTIVPTFEEKR